jgi:hypothetical protein
LYSSAIALRGGIEVIHQNEGAFLPLVLIDHRHQTGEMFRRTMGIECCPVWPFFNKNEVAWIFLIDKKIIGDAEFFLFGFLNQLAVQRHDDIDRLRPDEILRNDFEHKQYLTKTTRYDLLRNRIPSKLNQCVKYRTHYVKDSAQEIQMNRQIRLDKAQNRAFQTTTAGLASDADLNVKK